MTGDILYSIYTSTTNLNLYMYLMNFCLSLYITKESKFKFKLELTGTQYESPYALYLHVYIDIFEFSILGIKHIYNMHTDIKNDYVIKRSQ